MTSQRNKRVRSAIQLIVDCQRHSSGWMSLDDWVDLLYETLKHLSQWGHQCQLWNRSVAILLSSHPRISRYYERFYVGNYQCQVTKYMIDLEDLDREREEQERELQILMPEI